MKKLKIIYEDKSLLVVDKEPNKLTISTENEKINTLYHEARTYVKKQYPKNKIFIVHRLDKDTSGLIIFAKNEVIKNELQSNWENVTREYYAVVHGKMPKKEDTLINYLVEDKNLKITITNNPKIGKKAITHYEVLKNNSKYSLLRILIKTGRKNQIRIQLSNIGNPIVGDKKYGSISNPLKRLCLHACLLKYKDYTFESNIPQSFNKLIK